MLSIIIPTYNRLETLKRCLAAIDVQEDVDLANDVEVIVVDDGSSDATAQVCRDAGATVIVHAENAAFDDFIDADIAAGQHAMGQGFREADLHRHLLEGALLPLDGG